MAKKSSCGGGAKRSSPKTVPVTSHRRSKPAKTCYGAGKPGPKTVPVQAHERSKP